MGKLCLIQWSFWFMSLIYFVCLHLLGNQTALKFGTMQGMLTGLLGNISLLSYFAKKREAEAVVVQTLGVVSIYAVIVQLAMAGAMPLPHFTVTSIVVASGLVLNFLFYFGLLNSTLWNLWEDFITIGGVSAFPQVISIYWIYLLISLLLGQIMLFVLRVYISWGKRILGIKQN